eukprot:gene12515-6263_t
MSNNEPTHRQTKFNLSEQEKFKFKNAYRSINPIYKNRQRSKLSKFVAYTGFAMIGGVTAVGLAMDSLDYTMYKVGTWLGKKNDYKYF